MIDRTPSLRPEPRVHSSPETRSDVLPARPTLRRTREEVEVKQESKLNLNFQTFKPASLHFQQMQITKFLQKQNANSINSDL